MKGGGISQLCFFIERFHRPAKLSQKSDMFFIEYIESQYITFLIYFSWWPITVDIKQWPATKRKLKTVIYLFDIM